MDNYLLEPVSRRQQAELNASLARNLNPQIEASLAQTSKDRGVPLGVLRAADNQSLIPPLDTEALEGTSAAVKWYADSPNNAAVSRNDELNLVNIEKVADETTRSVKERMKNLTDSVKEKGYSPEQIKDLLTIYDPDPSDSVPFSSGRATLKGMPNARAQWPTMESWVAGQNETEHITKIQEEKNAARMKALQEFDKASFAGGFSAEEASKYLSSSEAASAYLDKLKNEIAVMVALHTVYPDWQNLDDAQLQDMVIRVKEYTGFDTASVNIARLRKAGASDVDWGKAFNAFGMNDLLEKKVGMTDEELAKVGYDSDMFSKLEKIRRLEEISNGLRGSDGWNMTLSGIAQSIPFVTELAATSPGGAYGAAKGVIKSSGWAKGLIPATKLILGQELKRLPAFIVPESAETVRGVGPQLTYMIDENGTRQEFLSPAQYDKLTTELTKNLIGRYISNSVEGLGNIVLPSGALEAVASRVVSAVPKAVRQRIGESMVISVMKDIAKTPKTAAAIASFRNAAEFGDIPQEYFEEKLEDWVRGISSYVGERTGIDAINFGDKLQVFKSPTEELATLGSVVGLMGVMHSPRIPAMVANARNTARFVDAQLALKDKVDASKTASVSPGHIESYLNDYLGIRDTAVLTSKTAETLFQSSPEIAAKIGLTQEVIAKAELEGRNIPVSMVRAQVVLSKPELYTLLQSAAPNSATPLSLEEVKKVNITEETVREAEAELKLRSEIKDALDGTRKELIAAGRSKSEANASARIIGSLATYFRLHSSADPIAFINGLKFRAVNEADFIKNFGADTVKQAAAAKSVGLTKGHPVFKDDTPVSILTPIPGAPVTFGETTIRATGQVVAYNQDSVKHSRGNDGLKVMGELAPHFKEMLENAVLVETEPGVGKSSVDKVYRYYSAVEIKGKVIAAELTVFGMKNGTFKLYDCRAKDSGIKKGEAGPPVRGGRTLNPGLATSPVISIRQLLEKVKPEYFDNPDVYRQGARGAITFADDYNAVVSLIEGKSDASTVVHESAHYIHRMMENLVKNNLADDRMKGDLARIDAWLSRDTTVSSRYDKAVEEAKSNGNPEPEFIKWSTTDRAERFARAFEAYILEGEAPSVETRSAFATLAKLLSAIYRSVAALNVELSSDIRRVFDGMLRTEEQAIRESAAKELLGSLNPEILGLGADEAKVFSDLAQKASDQTVEELHEEKMKQLKVLRKEWRAAANEEMKDMPVYKAWNHIKDAGGLTYASVIKYYGKEVADDLHSKGLVLKKTEGGTDALVFAADLDYPSPSHLIGELYTAKRPSEYIAEYIESNEAAFNREFDASAIALTAEANFESLDRISRFLAEKSGRTKSMMNKELFKLKAKAELDNTRVRDVVSDTLLLGSIRQNAKDLTQAANAGDFLLAFEAAQKLRFNLEVLRQKKDAKKYITKIESVLKRGRHAKPGTIEGDFHRGIQELSYRFNFTMSGPSSVGTKSLAELIDALREQNLLDVEWPAWLLSEYRDYRELTFEDFHVLGSMSQYLYGFGHEIIRNAKADRAATIEADIEECIAPAADMPKKYHDRKEGLSDTIGRAYRGFWASSEKLSRFLREFDGFSHVGTSGKEGPNERLIFRPLSQASAVNLDIKQRVDSELAPVWAYFHRRMPELKERLSGLPAFSQEIVDNAYSKWTPETVITAALNRGTADNYEKLKNGYGWKDADIDNVLSVLSSEDWANIQKIWDTIESMWPDLRSEFYKLNFFELEKIDAMPFDVTTSDGQTVSVKGGYYPLRYITKLDANIERRIAAGDSEAVKQLKAEPIHASADFTHRRRSGVKMPIDLRLNALVEHLDNVPHYISHRATMTRILKVVASPRYRDAFGTTQGYEKYRAMLGILEFIANPEKEKRAQAISWLNWSRAVLTTSALAFNPSSVIMQLASAPAGFSEVGAKYYFGAWQEFGLRRMELASEISRKSSYMRDRWNFLDLDMQGQMAKLRESGVQKAVRTFNKIGFMPMKAMDMAVAFPIWYAGYRRKLDEGVGEGAAISFADELVARTQGSGRSMDLSAIQLSAVGRALTPFFSAVSAIQNHWTYGVNAMKHGKMDTWTAATFILFDLLGVIMSGAVIRYMLAGGGDEGEKAFLRELSSSPVQGIPLVRDIADFTANSYMTGKLGYKDPVAVSSLDAVNEVLRKGLLVPKKYGKDPEGALVDASDVVSTVFQIPVVKIYKRGKRYYDRFFNENEGGLHE